MKRRFHNRARKFFSLTLSAILASASLSMLQKPVEVKAAADDITINYYLDHTTKNLYKQVKGDSSSGVVVEAGTNLPGRVFKNWTWYDSNEGTKTVVVGSTVVKAGKYNFGANYDNITYHVTYDPNTSADKVPAENLTGDMGSTPETKTYSPTSNMTLQTNKFKDVTDKYVVAGWGINTKSFDEDKFIPLSNGAATSVPDFGEDVSIGAGNVVEITLYAQWTLKTQKVEFDRNAGEYTISGTMTPQYVTYGVANQLKDNTFTATSSENISFRGWNTKADWSGTYYNDPATVYGFMTERTETENYEGADREIGVITLYAVWCPKTITYEFNVNNADSSSAGNERKSVNVGSTFNKQLTQPTKRGYKLAGWTIEKDDSSIMYGPAVAKTMSFNTTDGNIHLSGIGGDGSTSVDYKIGKVTTADVIFLYAYWEPKSITFTFNGGDATGTMAKLTMTAGDSDVQLPANKFVRTGYVFGGWGNTRGSTAALYTDEKTFTKDEIMTLVDSYSSQTLYAIWSAKTYKIVFDANAGSDQVLGTMDPMTVGYDVTTALHNVNYIRAGYIFSSWNTKADGTGTKLDNMAQIKNLTLDESVTLYAQWTKMTIEVTDIKISLSWDDASDQDGIRPDKLSFTLTGTSGSTKVSTTNHDVPSSESTFTIKEMPLQYLDGTTLKNISYKLALKSSVTGYSGTVSTASGGKAFNVKMKHTTETTTATVKITFDDNSNQDGARPASVQVKLKGSDGSNATANIGTTSGDSASYTFEGLKLNNKGTKVTYSIDQPSISGYTVSVNGTTITAKYEPKTISIKIGLTWDDENNKSEVRPDSVGVTLSGSTGRSYKETLKKASGYTATIEKLPMYNGGSRVSYAVTADNVDKYILTVTGDADKGFSITASLTDIAKSAITTMEEKKRQDEELKAQDQKRAEERQLEKEVEKTSVMVATIWNDEGSSDIRPDSYTIALKGSDGSIYPHTLTRRTSYLYTFTNVVAKDNSNKDVTFTIQYEEIPGYTTHVYRDKNDPTKFTIENFCPGQGGIDNRDQYDLLNDTEVLGSKNVITIPTTMAVVGIDELEDESGIYDGALFGDTPDPSRDYGDDVEDEGLSITGDDRTLVLAVGILAILVVLSGSIYIVRKKMSTINRR